MENGKQLMLPLKFINFLENQPENGIGYHLVEIELSNGIILNNRTVLNSTFLILLENEILNESDIKLLKLNN